MSYVVAEPLIRKSYLETKMSWKVVLVSLTLLASVAGESCKEKVDAITNKTMPMDMFIPECEADGSYKRIQCYNAFEPYCWCVDVNGNEILGTRVQGIGSKPTCGCGPVCAMHCMFGNEVDEQGCALCKCKPGPANCTAKRDYLLARRLVGAFVPKCEADGSYSLVQCHSSTGYCWCADWKSGEKIEGTDKARGESPLDCSKFARQCPDGLGRVYCLADPCSVSKCPNHPGAECVADYCGGCNANFYVNGAKVECENVAGNRLPCHGKPSLEGFSCGGFTMRESRPCPDGFFCHVDPADAFAVCCQKPLPERIPQKSEFLLKGNALLPTTGLYNRIPIGSCLVVEVREDVVCDGEHCEIPLLGKTVEPMYVMNNSIPYSLVLDRSKLQSGRSYSVSATANIGWCSNDSDGSGDSGSGDGDSGGGGRDEWIRKGDYLTEYAHSFVFDAARQSIVNDVRISPYELSLCGDKRCVTTAVCVKSGDGYCQCSSLTCPRDVEGEWVCASNQQSYASECLMKEADCFSGTINKVRDGQCPQKLASGSIGIKVGVSLACLVVLAILIIVIMVIYFRRHQLSRKFEEKIIKLEVEPNIYEGLPSKSKESLYEDVGVVKIKV